MEDYSIYLCPICKKEATNDGTSVNDALRQFPLVLSQGIISLEKLYPVVRMTVEQSTCCPAYKKNNIIKTRREGVK